MWLPVIHGVIERRILVNYRVDPDVVAAALPAPFRPKLHRGFGLVGICLIRLRGMAPRFLPSALGVSSENAAHRTAVQWEEDREICEGVFIRRRDTDARLNTLVGGKVFPGLFSPARFMVHESDNHFEVALRSEDGEVDLAVVGDITGELPSGSVFRSLAEASAFFQTGAVGYSATPDPQRFQGMELRCLRWQMEPLSLTSVRSSYFEDRTVFPAGSIEFDCALLMRGIEHEWHGMDDLCCLADSPQSEQSITEFSDSP